nr:hypothetical protein [Tanacetum cinerariifolium]
MEDRLLLFPYSNLLSKFLQVSVDSLSPIHKLMQISIISRPTVRKSKLLNSSSKSEREMVTNIVGTTRDVMEAKSTIANSIVANSTVRGIPVTLFDTAQIKEIDDIMENICETTSETVAIGADVAFMALAPDDLRHSTLLGSHPSAGTHYGGQYTFVYGSSALNSTLQYMSHAHYDVRREAIPSNNQRLQDLAKRSRVGSILLCVFHIERKEDCNILRSCLFLLIDGNGDGYGVGLSDDGF